MHFRHSIFLFLALCVFPGSILAAPGDARVVLLLSEEGGAYGEVADSFIARTKQLAKKIPDIEVVRVDDAHLDQWHGAGAPQFAVTVGTRAAQVLFDAKAGVPTLRVLIARNAHETLQLKAKETGIKTAAAAIYLEQPWDRQLDFVRRLLPKAQHLGAILGPASQHDAAEITSTSMHYSITPLLRVLAAQDDAGAIFKDIAEQSEVMLAVPDPAVLTPNSAKWLLFTAYQRGIPVIGFSKAYVSAGALGAVFSTPDQLGKQAAEIAVNALQDAAVDLGSAVYPKYFSVAINRSVARSLRLETPDDVELLRKLNAPEVPR